MAIYPASYRKRIHSGGHGLDIVDVAILSTLSFLAEHARDEGWFTVTQKELAERLGTYRSLVIRRLPDLERRGFIEIRTTARNGHYQASAYRLSLPARDLQKVTETTENSSARDPQEVTARDPQKVAARPSGGQRVRSYSKDVDDGAAPRGGGGDVQENPNQKTQAPPVPAQPQAAGPDGAEPEPRSEEELFAQWDSELTDTQETELATPRRIRLTAADYLAPSCPTCSAGTGQDCLGLQDGPKRQPAHRLRPTPVHASRLLQARLAAS